MRTSIQVLMVTSSLLGLAACGVFSSNDGDDRDGDGPPPPDAPRFLDFSVNSRVITDVQLATFTAVLTDPDGIDDLIGGSLKSPDGASYGAFQTSSAEGAYSLSLTWEQVSTVQTIDVFADAERTFVAEFYDAEGNTVTEEVTLAFECSDPRAGTCDGDGVCEAMDTVARCGSCDHGCWDGVGFGVNDIGCLDANGPDGEFNVCYLLLLRSMDDGQSCSQACAEADGYQCWVVEDERGDEMACDQTDPNPGRSSMDCYCLREPDAAF